MTDQPLRARSAQAQGAGRDRTRPPLPEALPAPVADSHCHLDIADGPESSWLPTANALSMAAQVGVTRVVQIGCDLPAARWAVEAASAHEPIVAGVALHPNEAPRLAEAGELDASLAAIEQLVKSQPVVRAVGETGLDYYRTGPGGVAAQQLSFRAHIALAKRYDKALVTHDRDAHEDVLTILDEEGAPERVVLHCFSGDAEFARACLDRGCYLSFAGTVTFKNAAPLREALRIAPSDRILVETDAPFLAPMPYRGRPNASYLIPLTMRTMAEVREVDLAELCHDIDANTSAAFGGNW
jgi:TatD DNase family protein